MFIAFCLGALAALAPVAGIMNPGKLMDGPRSLGGSETDRT